MRPSHIPYEKLFLETALPLRELLKTTFSRTFVLRQIGESH